MTTSIIQDIINSFEPGEFEELKKSILPFIKAHKKKLIPFVANFMESNPGIPLESIIKYYILSSNMPFNMKFFMESQSRKISRDIGPGMKERRQRQALVTQWIRKKAENYRSHSILRQIICFNKFKDELIPEIKRELGLHPSI